MPGMNAGILTNNYTVTPYTPAAGAYQNPYFTGGGTTQAGSNLEENQALANAQGVAAGGLATNASANASESGLAAKLAAIASGAAPSVAQAQLAQNTSTDVGAEMALAGQARGGNVGVGAYNSAAGAGNVTQQAAGEAATAGIAEREADAAQAGGLFGQVAGSGLGVANLGTQAGETAAGQSIAQQQAELVAQENQQQLQAQQSIASQQINATTAGQNALLVQKLAGGLASGAGTAAVAAFAEGGVVPGPATQKDDHPAALSGGELVIPVSDPSYAAIRAHLEAVKSSPKHRPSRGALIAARMGH